MRYTLPCARVAHIGLRYDKRTLLRSKGQVQEVGKNTKGDTIDIP